MQVSKAVPGFVEPERWSGRGAKATKRNIWSFKVMLFNDIDFFYYNIRLKESGWLSRYRTLSAISVQKLKFIIFQMGTFSHGRMLRGIISASADNPYGDLDYSGYHKNLIQ